MARDKKDMKRNMIGYAIQYFREKYDISQGILCRGLCSVATLSRIEAGERDVDAFILEALLERMGQTPNKFELVLTEKDYVLFHLREEIEKGIDKKDIHGIKECLNQYIKTSSSKSSVHKQFIKCMEARLNDLENGSVEISLGLLLEAISYTVPGFQSHSIETYHFSNTELNIISDIAQYKYELEEIEEAKSIIVKVLNYIKNYRFTEITNVIYDKSIVVISKILLKEKAYEEALEICESGLKFNKRSRKLDYRGDLSLIKAKIIDNFIHEFKDDRFSINDLLSCYLQAYYVYDFTEEYDKANEIKAHIQEGHPWVNID